VPGDRQYLLNPNERRRKSWSRGDTWFRSGDLLARDKDGWFTFVDRVGDTFRWKGENVATQQVEGVLAGFREVSHANVYGVAVAGADGRAGMAAIVPRSFAGFAADAFYRHVTAHLPAYACPLFVRLVATMDETGTLKLRKAQLQADGFDPDCITDPLLVRVDAEATYAPLTRERYRQILAEPSRLGR
jgi:fatty-acyl-CoA synthase